MYVLFRAAFILIIFKYWAVSEMAAFEKELNSTENEKLKVINLFCRGKHDNFCSRQNLVYMHKVLQLQHEQQL